MNPAAHSILIRPRISLAEPRYAGPFAEGCDLVLGFSIWQVRDMDEAVAWAQRKPLAAAGEIEIRPFYEPEDLAERGRLGVA